MEQPRWPRIADVLHRLDDRNLAAVGSLMIAVSQGANAIEGWILPATPQGNTATLALALR